MPELTWAIEGAQSLAALLLVALGLALVARDIRPWSRNRIRPGGVAPRYVTRRAPAGAQ